MSQTVIVESWVVPRRLSQSLTVNYTLEWRWIEGERKHELLRHAGRKNLLHLWKFQVNFAGLVDFFYGKALQYIFSSFENIHPSIHASIYPSIFFRLSKIGLRWQQAKQGILGLFSPATLSSSFWRTLRWSQVKRDMQSSCDSWAYLRAFTQVDVPGKLIPGVLGGSSPAKPKEMTFSHLTVGPPPAGRDIGVGCVASRLAGNSKKLWRFDSWQHFENNS